jgi:drug/metabolite transporter (DMT)-like permease
MLHALIALMVLLWAGNFIVGKFALREFPPLLLSGVRMWIAAAVIAPFYWFEQRKSGRVTGPDVRMLIGIGTFGLALNQVFFVWGLSLTSVAHSAIIIGLTPIIVLLMAAARGQERITGRKVAGMAIALIGVAVLKAFEVKPASGAGPTWTGDLLMLVAVTTFSAFTVFGKTATDRHSPVTVSAYAYLGAALGLAPTTLWQIWHSGFPVVSAAGWGSILYMAVFSSVVCYLIYYYALSHMLPSRVSAFSYLQPPLATSLGILILGEPLTGALAAATCIILLGVYQTERG